MYEYSKKAQKDFLLQSFAEQNFVLILGVFLFDIYGIELLYLFFRGFMVIIEASLA